MDATTGIPVILEHAAYRTGEDVDQQRTPYSNVAFISTVLQAFKAKQGYVTPADIAFVEVVIAATMREENLKTMQGVEKLYRDCLVYAKNHMGTFNVANPIAGKRPISIHIGNG